MTEDNNRKKPPRHHHQQQEHLMLFDDDNNNVHPFPLDGMARSLHHHPSSTRSSDSASRSQGSWDSLNNPRLEATRFHQQQESAAMLSNHRALHERLTAAESDFIIETFRRNKKPATNKPKTKAVARDSVWHAKYQELLFFLQTHGHCNVPAKYPPNPSLSHWVKRQRSNWKAKYNSNSGLHPDPSSCLDAYREDLLNRIGFVWDIHKDAWDAKFRLLLQYQQEFGSLNVPVSVDASSTPNGYTGLGVWVKCQRRQYRILQDQGYSKSNLTPDRVAQLDAIGFAWAPRANNGSSSLSTSSSVPNGKEDILRFSPSSFF